MRFLFTTLIVFAALLIWQGASVLFATMLPPIFVFSPALIIIVLQFGVWPGLFAIGLSCVLGDSMIFMRLVPQGGITVSSRVALVLFAFTSVFLCIAVEVFRRDQLRLAVLEKKEALREHENLLELFIEHAPARVLMLDAKLRCLAASKQWIEQYALGEHGLSKEQVIGRSVFELFDDVPEKWKEAYRRGIKGEAMPPTEDRYLTKDGEERWLYWEIVPWFKGSGQIGGIIVNSADITEQKKTEKSLRASEAHYRAAFQTCLDGISITRISDGMLIDVNQANCDMFGYSRDEALGQTTLGLGLWVSSKDRESMVEFMRQKHVIKDFQAQFRKKNGDLFWGLASVSMIELSGEACAMAVVRDLSEAQSAQAEIHNLAFYDSLTGLANRRLFLEQLQQGMAISARNGSKGAVLYIDIDNFRFLNDTLGHEVGDEALRILGQRLKSEMREIDTVSRLGGDEFAILLAELSANIKHAAHYAKSIAERLVAEIARPLQLNGHEFVCSCSIGIAIFDDHEATVCEIMKRADIAMYQAKQTGHNTISFFSQMLQTAVNARAATEEELRGGIRNSEFVLYYQPQIEFGRITGVEGLLRWNHPQRGLLPPGEFIAEAEETGQIIPLGDWALESACKQINAWAKHPLTSAITVAVNMSALQMRDKSFVSSVLNTIERYGVNPWNLELELTETMLFEDVESLIAKMTKLKAYGMKFAIDDFGTGFSSLSYLKRFPVDHLKIDRSFVHDLPGNSASGAIAQAIISLGHALGLSVIAEGVETEQQREYLARLGCNIFQGYLYSMPVPVEQLEVLLSGLNGGIFVVPQDALLSTRVQ